MVAGGLVCLLGACSAATWDSAGGIEEDWWEEDAGTDAGAAKNDAGPACLDPDAGGCIAFPCQNGYSIPTERVCDGFWDCEYGEDEDLVVCVDDPPEMVFVCDDGNTVPDYFQCDGVPDCPNGEDEVRCPVHGDGGYICSNGYDLPDQWWCDGEDDCPDGEDETLCDLDAGAGDAGVDGGVDAGVDGGEQVTLELIDGHAPAR